MSNRKFNVGDQVKRFTFDPQNAHRYQGTVIKVDRTDDTMTYLINFGPGNMKWYSQKGLETYYTFR